LPSSFPATATSTVPTLSLNHHSNDPTRIQFHLVDTLPINKYGTSLNKQCAYHWNHPSPSISAPTIAFTIPSQLNLTHRPRALSSAQLPAAMHPTQPCPTFASPTFCPQLPRTCTINPVDLRTCTVNHANRSRTHVRPRPPLPDILSTGFSTANPSPTHTFMFQPTPCHFLDLHSTVPTPGPSLLRHHS